MHKQTTLLPTFGLLFGAVCWGIIWYPYRLIADLGLSGVVASFYTYLITMTLAGFFSIQYWRGAFGLPKHIIWLCLVAGWTNISYVLAVINGEVMRVMLLFYLSPIWTLILAHFWLKENTHLTGLIAISVSLIGAGIMLYDPALNPLPIPQNAAEWLGVSAGLGFSLTNVITRKSTHLSVRAKSFAVWFGVVIVAVVLMLFLDLGFVLPKQITAYQWGIMLLIALSLIAATVFVQYGVTKITAVRASILFMFELVVAAIAAYYLANETMQLNEWIGGTLIVTAALFSSWHHED
jgi:drug/metabolite transporter (DMT)-like permease